MGRVVVVGIDGLAHGMWKELASSGVMPRSAELFETGKLVPMRSSIPDVSSVAWTSMVTGKNPGTHNVYGFTDIKVNIDRNPGLADRYQIQGVPMFIAFHQGEMLGRLTAAQTEKKLRQLIEPAFEKDGKNE